VFTLDDLLEGTHGELVSGSPEATFRAISIDSRTTAEGDLFVAFRGQAHDGHHFVAHALERGAAGALVEILPSSQPWASSAQPHPPIVLCRGTAEALADLARYWRQRHDLTVVGVTGSVGKTTTKEMIASLLGSRMTVLRSPANYNTEIGLPMTMMQLEPCHRAAVLEMGMHRLGDIRRLAQIAKPQIGVVTNVHPTHLERLGTIARIAQAKRELIEELPTGGFALLNADDPRVSRMRAHAPCAVLTFGMTPSADIWASDVVSRGLGGTEFSVHFAGQQVRSGLSIPGRHVIHAALAAIGVAIQLGMPFSEATARIRGLEISIDGRLQRIPGPNHSTLLNDAYNASPTSMLAALDLLAETEGRHIAVLGDMLELGSFEREGHRIVGRRAARTVDRLIAVGPRSEEIAHAASAAGLSPATIQRFSSPEDAIEAIAREIQPGDVVLIKGSHGVRLDRIVEALRSPDADRTGRPS